MKTYKICKKTNEVVPYKPLTCSEMVYSGGLLCMVFQNDSVCSLSVGDIIHFEKTASGNSGEMLKVCETDSIVRNIVYESGATNVYVDYTNIAPLTVSSFIEISSSDYYNYKFFFTDWHNMVPGDFEFYEENYSEPYEIYVRRGENVIGFSDLALCFPNHIVKGGDYSIDGGCAKDLQVLFNYETMDRGAVLCGFVELVSGEEFIPQQGDKVYFCTNPFFFTQDNGKVTCFNNVNIYKYEDFMNLGVLLEEDDDTKRMYQEYQVNELFVDKVKETIIPGFIDLEKLKYTPAFFEPSTSRIVLATGLTFNLHFRTRVSGATKYSFEDVWHTDDTIETWNGLNYNAPVSFSNLYDNVDFVNSSNLMGFLGFTDDDIFNQKARVKQSFLRLSFYDSPNPLEQNLLFYSTIFIDSGDLYGKFVKRKAWLESIDDRYNEIENPVVWSSGSSSEKYPPITCQLTVNDEYDTTKSGDGFNLYLFKADAPLENEEQDIYMKVEFNHAGYGRTVPMIFWKKDENETDKPTKLTTKNYLENLYIKLKVKLTDKGYVYTFNDIISSKLIGGRKNGIVWEDERIVLNLFEPMITKEEETD